MHEWPGPIRRPPSGGALSHEVPIAIVGPSGSPPPSGQLATFFFVDDAGNIGKTFNSVPVQNGVAVYQGEPLPHGAFWAITVADPGQLPFFRSGKLTELPGPPGITVLETRIVAFRATQGGSVRLDAEDGGALVVRDRVLELSHEGLQVLEVQVGADPAAHYVVNVQGIALVSGFIPERFTYTLALSLSPASGPADPRVVIAEPAAPPDANVDLGSQAAALQAAVIDGVEKGLAAAFGLIASIEVDLAGGGFQPNLISVTSVGVEPYLTAPNLVATVHGGAVVGGIGTVAEAGSLNLS
jgi:hypothetical protein